MSDNLTKLTDTNLLVKNTAFSLVGHIIPLLAAIFSIPILIESLGVIRFGVLTLVWMITGYFGLLDLGIGRALTKFLSERLGNGNVKDISYLIWNALIVAFFMGTLGALLLGISSPILVEDFFKIPVSMYDEVKKCFLILCISIPLIISLSVLRGTLESYQRFDLINLLRVPIGSLTFLGPLIVLLFSDQLTHVVYSLVLIRVFEFVIMFFFCSKIIPEMIKKFNMRQKYTFDFFRFGGWITISNVIGSIMIYLDRILISSIISVGAVTYYATSYEIVMRLMVIPGAIVGVLFPAFGALVKNDFNKAMVNFNGGIKYNFILMFPIVLIIFLFSKEVLDLWLGEELSLKGYLVLKYLAIGALINSLSYFPYAMLHAYGRPDLTAKLHLIETPLYIIASWILIEKFGIEGAAIAWVIKTTFDTSILFFLVGKILNMNFSLIKKTFIFLTLGILILAFSNYLTELYAKIIFTTTIILIVSFYFWNKMLKPIERNYLFSFFRSIKFK